MFRRMFMKKKAPKRMPLATITNELFLPTRLVYEVYDARRLNSWLVNTSCMAWDERLERWVWLHCDAALDLDFAPAYDKVPKKSRPVVLATCYLVDDQTFHVYTRCGLRAAKFLTFFDRAVLRTVAMGKFIDQYNLVTDMEPGEVPPIPEDYFQDEDKIYFFDLAALIDSPDSPARTAAIEAALETSTLRPLERHRLEDFYEDGPEAMEMSNVFREYMAGIQYHSDKPICLAEEFRRLIAQLKK
jgi:hypothetical protein